MNLLTLFSKPARLIVAGITLAGCLAIGVAAQTTDPSSQGKRYGEPGFRGEPINLNVVNADIRDILSYITDQYGINFVIDKSVKEVPVTVKVNDVPWNIALESVLQSQELGIQVNGNILRIADNKTLAAEGELLRKRMESQLDTSPLVTEMIRLNYATVAGGPQPGKATAGSSSDSGGGAGDAAGGTGAGAGAAGGGLLPIIKRRLSTRGAVEVEARSNSLIVTDVPANVMAIKQLIAILDQPEPQVEIEARIVVATRNFSRDIGVQLGAVVVGNNNAAASGGTLPGLTSALPRPPGQPVPSISNDLVSKIANTAIGLTTGVFGTAQLSAIISAGEQRGQAKVIATPRVTALNNQQAEIKSTTKIPITTVQPGAATGGAIIATTTYVDVPLKLEITPQITDDGTVILTVLAENSSTATVLGNAAPAINAQSMKTQVIVPDGGTTVVGGVLFDDERDNQDRTPGLASVPLLGNLFKRKGVSRNTNEILFFITPRISRTDASNRPPRNTSVPQPVPLGNPPSNSSPVVPVPGGVPTLTSGPATQAVPAPSPKTN